MAKKKRTFLPQAFLSDGEQRPSTKQTSHMTPDMTEGNVTDFLPGTVPDSMSSPDSGPDSGPAFAPDTNASRSDSLSNPLVLDAMGLLLDHLRIRNRPARLDELLRELGLARHEKKEVLAQLDALADRGDILRLAGGRWLHAGNVRRVRGLLSVQKSGVGFVTPDTDSARDNKLSGDVFIRQDAQADAWDGDVVEVILTPGHLPNRVSSRETGHQASSGSRNSGGRSPEGRIVRVLTRGRSELIVQTTTHQTAHGILAHSSDSRINSMFDVDVSALAERPVSGSLLRVRIDEKIEQSGQSEQAGKARKSGRSKQAGQAEMGLWKATALAALGNEYDASVQERLVKINHHIPMEFPAAVDEEAASLARDARPENSEHSTAQHSREDLRQLDFVTIDGADARDFDDAIHVAATNSGYCLHVAIADVSWYVRPGSGLDREARERGNSCYFPLSVEPMLPEPLSTDLCSLRPDLDRFVMVARMDIEANGRVSGSSFMPAVIRSRARLTYEGVQAELDRHRAAQPEQSTSAGSAGIKALASPTGSTELARTAGSVPLSLAPMLHSAAALARILRQARMERGALDMDLPEPAYDVDAQGRVTGIHKARTLFAHHLIEECMLCANEAVARFLAAQELPFPSRVHPEPDLDRLDALFHTLAASSLPPELLAKLPSRPTATALKPLLDAARGTPQAFVVNRLVLRTMMQAKYTAELAGHFGLASACYCHFTSPIRRYADLIVHRALRHALGQGVGPIPARHKLLAVADQCNVRERAAQDAEREMTRRMACLLLAGRETEVFEGVIAGVMDFGFFVELADMPVEGMVRIATLNDDWYAYDSDRQELVGAGTGRAFRIGQAVTVRLERADLGRLEIDLALIRAEDTGPARTPARRPGTGQKHNGNPQRTGFDRNQQQKESRYAPHRQGKHGSGIRGKRAGRG